MSRYADDKRWRRVRARKLRDTPGCERCSAPATQVHHRDELGLDGPNAYEPSNLESLCQSCHSQHTARGRGGWRTAPRRREPERHPGLVDQPGGTPLSGLPHPSALAGLSLPTQEPFSSGGES